MKPRTAPELAQWEPHFHRHSYGFRPQRSAHQAVREVQASPLREIDKWVRRKLRCYLWKQWGPAGYRELRKRGVTVREAWNILTDNGREFCGKPQSHPYELLLAIEDIEHRNTKVSRLRRLFPRPSS